MLTRASGVRRALRDAVRVMLALLVLGATAAVHAADAGTRQYTFSWRFQDGDRMAPRGGTTQGPPVDLASILAPAWTELQAPGLSAYERDRRAILAMAGEFRTSFDFIEVAGFRAPWSPERPYQSWATEKIYVVEDRGETLSLQHVLVMKVLDPAGHTLGPFVTRHWRQEWRYQPDARLVYRGHQRWQTIAVSAQDARGQWLQSVWQVDDSPRYSGLGRWQHFGNYSSWVSAEGWRPLPRREFSTRDDYQVLIGTNRHTITPDGWIHEEQNLKVALDALGAPQAELPVLAREFGLNRYERIVAFDWSAGDRYVERTAPLWSAVRDAWRAHAAAGDLVLRGAADQERLFTPLFDYADQLAAGATPTAQAIERFAAQAVADYLLPAGTGPAPATAPHY